MVDVLTNIVKPALEHFSESQASNSYMKGLIELKFRGKKETKGYQAALNILGFSREECANVDQRYIDYWIYLEGGTTWDMSCYGLLRFLIECFVEID